MEYKPYIVVWEITYKCNAHCIHCGSDCGSFEKPHVLSTDECLKIISDLKVIGAKNVILSGGEPLLRADIATLAEALNNAGIDVSIISNGIAVSEKNINMIKKLNLKTFGLSLDAGDALIHDYIRGFKGAFNKVIDAFELLNNNQIIPSVVTTVHKLNFSELPKIRDLLIKNNIQYWQIQYADSIGRMPREAMITEAQFFELSKFIYDLKCNYGDKFRIISGSDIMGYMSDWANAVNDGWSGCQAGKKVLGIGSDGSVRGCLSLQSEKYIEDYVQNRSLAEIWNDENAFSYNRQFNTSMLSGFCADCEYAADCKGGCVRAATCGSENTRCNNYCLYKLEKNGYSSSEQARTDFSKLELYSIYNPISRIPDKFFEYNLS